MEFHVGDASLRHRVSVRGLGPAQLDDLRGGDEARLAAALAVYVGEPGAHRPAVLGAHSVDAEGLHFQPRFPFVTGVRYTARLDLGDGEILDHAFVVGAPEGPTPTVVAVFPSGDTLPENALRLYVHFSQAMETRDAQRHVHLLDEAGGDVPLAFVEIEHGLWDPEQTRLTLLFHPGRVKRGIAPGERLGPPLRAGRSYRLVVDGAMADAAGRPLSTPFEKKFAAVAADRASPRAKEMRVHAPRGPSEPLVVDLPEPLDAALLQRLVWVEDARGGRIEGTIEVSAGETRWSFRSTSGWAAGEYAVHVHPALEDRAGNRFDRLFDRDAAAGGDAAAEPILFPFRVDRLSVQGALP
ncbi:MAG TPA: hypothetical protein VKA01_15300 [Vicinamibacteria bacterium]|nr:hypothetical protein [Vicinamibacteria bacterium]